ncbi:MAG: hypothetical protein PHP25_01600 [Candidatus Moranbacteria bacterium]|nr:hypothetical protein [Candidatus Moranbacteria bacterium]
MFQKELSEQGFTVISAGRSYQIFPDADGPGGALCPFVVNVNYIDEIYAEVCIRNSSGVDQLGIKAEAAFRALKKVRGGFGKFAGGDGGIFRHSYVLRRELVAERVSRFLREALKFWPRIMQVQHVFIPQYAEIRKRAMTAAGFSE